jgi:hypothetical protein
MNCDRAAIGRGPGEPLIQDDPLNKKLRRRRKASIVADGDRWQTRIQWTAVWNSVWISFWVAFLASPSSNLFAQDQITLRDERTGKLTEFQALVISWDESQLVYSGNNRQSTVAGSRVVAVGYARSAAQSAADQQFENGQFAQAWQSYETAIGSESRDWIKVEMLAAKLRCASALGRQSASI